VTAFFVTVPTPVFGPSVVIRPAILAPVFSSVFSSICSPVLSPVFGPALIVARRLREHELAERRDHEAGKDIRKNSAHRFSPVGMPR